MARPWQVARGRRRFHRPAPHHRGTIERYTGDGIIVLFNDPVPASDLAERAAGTAGAMRASSADLNASQCKFDDEPDFGVGNAQGYWTIGAIGFGQRYDYRDRCVMSFTVRLCEEAKPGQILISQRGLAMVNNMVTAEPVGPLVRKRCQPGSRPDVVKTGRVWRTSGPSPSILVSRRRQRNSRSSV